MTTSPNAAGIAALPIADDVDALRAEFEQLDPSDPRAEAIVDKLTKLAIADGEDAIKAHMLWHNEAVIRAMLGMLVPLKARGGNERAAFVQAVELSAAEHLDQLRARLRPAAPVRSLGPVRGVASAPVAARGSRARESASPPSTSSSSTSNGHAGRDPPQRRAGDGAGDEDDDEDRVAASAAFARSGGGR